MLAVLTSCADFVPRLDVVDSVAQTSSRYNSSFLFQVRSREALEMSTYNRPVKVVGGGSSLGTIRAFTDGEIEMYNLNKETIWTFVDDSGGDPDAPVLNAQRNAVSWVCSPGSPCSGIWPRFPRTPEYFVRIRVSSAR